MAAESIFAVFTSKQSQLLFSENKNSKVKGVEKIMNAVKTIDVRNLEHSAREKLVFPSIDKLKNGETLRILFEFNPAPLVFMLKAQDKFDVSFEKQGPIGWILCVKKAGTEENKKAEVKQLLKELKNGKLSSKAKKKAKKIFENVDAKTIGIIEQELIHEGVSHDEIRQSLCDIHLEAIGNSLVKKRIKVKAPHPVHTLMEEHKIILKNLKELALLAKRLSKKNSFEAARKDLERLKDIAHNLVEAESHHQREEDVLFPKLEAHDIVEPPQIMKMDHVEFRKRKQELFKLSQNPKSMGFARFKHKVIELANYLSSQLESHIFKEDNILYQIALQVLNEKEWKEIKRDCDKIGYCCFTPKY